VLLSKARQYTVLHCIAQYYAALHCTVLYIAVGGTKAALAALTVLKMCTISAFTMYPSPATAMVRPWVAGLVAGSMLVSVDGSAIGSVAGTGGTLHVILTMYWMGMRHSGQLLGTFLASMDAHWKHRTVCPHSRRHESAVCSKYDVIQ
jgi:hypothetical protein